MNQVRLGRSNLRVSPIAFGAWELGGDWGATDEAVAVATIRHAADRGINFFDPAQGYGFGASESLIARAHDIGVLAYGPLSHGLLSGALNAQTTFAPGDWRAKSDVFRGDLYRRNLRIVDALSRFAELEFNTTVSRLAVAWVLANPAVQ